MSKLSSKQEPQDVDVVIAVCEAAERLLRKHGHGMNIGMSHPSCVVRRDKAGLYIEEETTRIRLNIAVSVASIDEPVR